MDLVYKDLVEQMCAGYVQGARRALLWLESVEIIKKQQKKYLQVLHIY